MAYQQCFARLQQAAGRQLSDQELARIFERIHRAALDIKAGRTPSAAPTKLGPQVDGVIQQAAQQAAVQLMAEAKEVARQAQLQVVKLSARVRDVDGMTAAGIDHLDAVERTIRRDYTGKVNVESLEQRIAGYRAEFGRRLGSTWNAFGKDYWGFFQDRQKALDLVREIRGEDTGNALAKAGAKAWRDVAEEMRAVFNQAGGDVGKLDDWGMPQHHSQERVATAGKQAWVDAVLPRLDRGRYVDDLGQAWPEKRLREFLGKAWDTIATNGHANVEPGKFQGTGKRANRHAESRQIHFKDAESTISYWEQFGDKTILDVLSGHVEVMARDIGFVEHFGPNPDTTYRTLRDLAVHKASLADPVKTPAIEGRAKALDTLFDYVAGRTSGSMRPRFSRVVDSIMHLNVASKLGGAALASLFGDKAMMEAVRHLNHIPLLQAWRTELSLLNPLNAADRAQLQRQGLMLEAIRSGLNRFNDALGESGFTGKLANATMRVTGMTAINDIRKASFGLSLMGAIGNQIKAGVDFAKLPSSDIRALRNYGITEADWKIWKLAKLEDMGGGNDAVLTPDAVGRVADADIAAAMGGGVDAATLRRDAIVKLLGAVNTESEFAIVTPGFKERAQFYGGLRRGTVPGEIARSVLQFKSFPWAMLQRGMDAVANADAPAGKAVMTAYLVAATTLAGAMLIQTRDMLAGKDPRDMTGDKALNFWAAAFLQGGALGIYGDFLYGAGHTRYGSGILESLAGPTVGPLLELGLTQPISAITKTIEGKETHFVAQTLQDLKGFVPGGNVWYAKAALDHLIFQQVFEMASPGYLASMRSRTAKEYGQDWYWTPGEATPDRGPDFVRMFGG